VLDLEIVPGVRIGPFSLYDTEERLTEICRGMDGFTAPANPSRHLRGFWQFDFGMFLKARLDSEGRAQTLQISGSGAFAAYNAEFQGMNLLATPAEEVIRLLGTLDEVDSDEFAFRITAPTLGLALARDVVPDDEDDEDGRYFTSVLTAVPGSIDL
jgi:hypothetical protein